MDWETLFYEVDDFCQEFEPFLRSRQLMGSRRKRRRDSRLSAIRKTTMGWFFGFKLHLVINECGELLAAILTPGNVDDREPLADFGPAPVRQALWRCHNWANRSAEIYRLSPLADKILLRKRSLIETVNDQLKNMAQIEHSRHRSPINFAVHLLAGLIGYTHQEKKPMLRMSGEERSGLARLALPPAP